MNHVFIKWLTPVKNDKELRRRIKNYFCWRKKLYLNNKLLGLNSLKKLVNKGEKVFIEGKDKNKVIYCKISINDPWDYYIPRVTKSNHKRFVVGTRFDYGFMSVALEEGYSIQYN